MPASRADTSGYRQNGDSMSFTWLNQTFRKRIFFVILLLLATGLNHASPSTPSTFDEITFWAGYGEKRAALVIQWNDGVSPASILWGFRWNGEARGIDMLKAIAGSTVSRDDGQLTFLPDASAGADPRLALSLVNYSWGIALEGLVFTDRELVRTQNDGSTGYWEYSIFGGEFEYFLYDAAGSVATYSVKGSYSYSADMWFSSPIGASDRPLIDGSWDALSFASDSISVPVVQPSPALPPPPTAKSIQLNSSTELEIIFTTTPNISYQLESKEDLLASEWSLQGNSVSAISAETKFIVLLQSNKSRWFFRLRQSP